MPVVTSEFEFDKNLIEVIQSLCNTHDMFSNIPRGNFLSDTHLMTTQVKHLIQKEFCANGF